MGVEVDGILWEQQLEDILPKLVHKYMESLAPDAPVGAEPLSEWLAEAYQYA